MRKGFKNHLKAKRELIPSLYIGIFFFLRSQEMLKGPIPLLESRDDARSQINANVERPNQWQRLTCVERF